MTKSSHRLSYIDWLRGLACLFMFQTHCYDSWLGGPARDTKFFWYSQLGGTVPAPLFLFLAGLSFAFVTDRMREKGIDAGEIARTTIRRGAEVFGLAMLFRLQEFLLGWRGAPWTDLLRVDVLNVIGLSLILLGITCWLAGTIFANRAVPVRADRGTESPPLTRLRRTNAALAALIAAAIVLATPPLWTTLRPRWLPWYLETYVNGVHIYDSPRPWLFPLFPWAAFAFFGLAVGFLLLSPWARRHEWPAIAVAGTGGACLMLFGWWLSNQHFQFYAVEDFWHTSPSFFLMRLGMLGLLLLLAYVWCRWGAGEVGFSPVIELGRSSLLVYWVHIEFVYGGISILTKRAQTIGSATAGLAVIALAMIVMATIHNRMRGKGFSALAFWRNPSRATA